MSLGCISYFNLHQVNFDHIKFIALGFWTEIMTKYLSFQKFKQESKLTEIFEGKCPKIDASGLLCLTKINHMANDLGKLLSIIWYVDKTLF